LETEILYTDKLFGAHICSDQVFDEGWEIFNEDRRYYYDCLMAPHARQVETALDKLSELQVRLYATGHGPLVRYSLIELTQAYHRWSLSQTAQDTTVALLYASAYGNTATLAQAIARGITKAGVGVEAINCEVAESAEIQAALEKSVGFIIGSPTLGGHAPTPIQTALGIVLSTTTNSKLAGVFGSYGWSGEAIDLIEGKLRDGGYRFGFETLRVKFKPTDASLKLCEEAGTDFAQSLKKQKSTYTTKPATNVEQAVGRVIGSLCVVTAKQEDVASAMLADWVSQATFNPPGLTVAVAKDRAIESLMYPSSHFVLNILAEGNHLGLMKHFLKPFALVKTDLPVLPHKLPLTAHPSLAMPRLSRMFSQQPHGMWRSLVVYATVENGKLLNPNAMTAIHHRKSGNHY
jgi:flavin reductase (DIM6/NTAB) family NADH-FMN oxidoreductase RutF